MPNGVRRPAPRSSPRPGSRSAPRDWPPSTSGTSPSSVGMQAPSLYSYFDSKHAIYDAMFAQGAQEFLERERAVETTDDALRDLQAGARMFVGFCTEDPVRYQLMFQRYIPGFEPSAESYAIAVEGLQVVRDRLARAGLTDPARPRPVHRGHRRPHQPADIERARWRPLGRSRRRSDRDVPRARQHANEEEGDAEMTTTATRIERIPAIDRHEAATIAATEYQRFVELLRALGADDWSKPTDCPAWDVRAIAGHTARRWHATSRPCRR